MADIVKHYLQKREGKDKSTSYKIHVVFLYNNDFEKPYIDISIDLQLATFIYYSCFCIVLTIASNHEIYCPSNKHGKNMISDISSMQKHFCKSVLSFHHS